MKSIIAILSESPFYFTIPLQERYALVKLMASGSRRSDQEIDLNRYESRLDKFLQKK